MADLIKTTTVLELQEDDYEEGSPRVYMHPEGRLTTLALDPDVYWDLGGPLWVTVTIEPGDKLND